LCKIKIRSSSSWEW